MAERKEVLDKWQCREYGSVVCREVLCNAKPRPFKCGAKVKLAAEIVEKMMSKEEKLL
mgnify:CR=1 FL=1